MTPTPSSSGSSRYRIIAVVLILLAMVGGALTLLPSDEGGVAEPVASATADPPAGPTTVPEPSDGPTAVPATPQDEPPGDTPTSGPSPGDPTGADAPENIRGPGGEPLPAGEEGIPAYQGVPDEDGIQAIAVDLFASYVAYQAEPASGREALAVTVSPACSCFGALAQALDELQAAGQRHVIGYEGVGPVRLTRADADQAVVVVPFTVTYNALVDAGGNESPGYFTQLGDYEIRMVIGELDGRWVIRDIADATRVEAPR